MIFLIDTNVISELRLHRPHGAVLAWYRAHRSEDFALPSIALYEIQAGVEKTREQDEFKALEIEAWLASIIEELRVIDFDGAAARMAARFMHKQSKALTEDAMIAAIAKANRLTIATRNTADFKMFGVSLVNPYEYSRR